MAEEANLDVKNNAESKTAETESSPVETNTDEVINIIEDDNFATEENDGTDTKDASTNKTTDVSETEASKNDSEDTSRKNAETRKQQLNNEIRDKVAERNALRKEIAELNAQKYQLKNPSDIPTVEALMEQRNPETGDYYTRTEAKVARMEAERKLEQAQKQMDEYTDHIVDNRLRLKDEASRALKDFPMFDEESDSYNKELAEKANQIAENLIIKDETTGEIIGSRGSIYDVYALVANAAKSAETNGKIAGRRAAVDMMNSADILGSSGSDASNDDNDNPFLKGFRRGND